MNHSPTRETAQIHGKKLFIWGIAILIPIFLFTPLALVQFLCLFFLFILISSRFYSKYLIRNIRVIREDSELRVFKHEWVRVELKIENRGLLPAFMLVAGDSTGKLHVFKREKIFCTLSRRSWTLLRWEGYCSGRGVFNIGPAIVRGGDPLGLFPFHLTSRETSKLYVYPVFRSISIKASGGIPLGNMICANPLFEDITRSRSLRSYNPGDEPRRINWKMSAHVSGTRTGSGSLLVNEYEATASYPLMIFLNIAKNEYPLKKQNDYIERTIEAAAALCLRASAERQELGIIFFTAEREGGISVIAPSAHTLVPILEQLAAVDWTVPSGSENTPQETAFAHNSAMVMLEQGKRLPYGTRYVYTGCNLDDEAYISLNSLKKNHLRLEYIIIDERTVPSIVPGNSPRYQMKESGYEII
jgi:uncharacterized protein (DUF58 family)